MILGIHHVTFLCSNLARSRNFYEEVLGFRPDFKRPDMSYDGVWYELAPNQQIHLMALPDPEAGLQRPVHGGRDRHVALAISDLTHLQGRLDTAKIVYTLSQSGRRALFCRDPDQNALEFIDAQTG